MNEVDLMTAVRDRFAAVRMDTPAETIMARGSSLRRRRGGGRLAAVAAGALAVSVGAGLSVPALTAGTAAPAQRAALAAWTVHKHHDGSIGVTIRRWQNIGALQVRLGALGVPVIIAGERARPGRGCALMWIRPAAFEVRFSGSRHAVAFEVMPGKIPPHAVLWIARPGQRPAGALEFAIGRASAMSCKPLTPVAHAH